MSIDHIDTGQKFWYNYPVMERLRTTKGTKKARKHGFLARRKTANGRTVIARRRAKNRKRIAQ